MFFPGIEADRAFLPAELMEAVVGKLSLRCRGQVDVKRRSNIRRSDGQHTLLRHAVEFVVPTDDPSVPLHQSKGEAETLLLVYLLRSELDRSA